VRRIHLSAGTHDQRHAVTTQVMDALGRVGVVEDARHSNKEVAIRLSLASGGMPALRTALAELPLRLSAASAAELAKSPPEKEAATVWLVITFVHDEPDLRITAPAVPG